MGIIRSLGMGRFLGWAVVEAEGVAGGILIFYDKRVIELVGMEVGIFSISYGFRNYANGFPWMFFGVNSPVVNEKREYF